MNPIYRELRLARGLSQQKLADAVGVSKAYVSFVETGVELPSNNYRRRFAKILGFTFECFCKIEEYVLVWPVDDDADQDAMDIALLVRQIIRCRDTLQRKIK